MKILFVCNEYPPAPYGGVGVFVRTLARGLALHGHKVFVVGLDRTATQSGWTDDGGVSVLRVRPRYSLKQMQIGRFNVVPNVLNRIDLTNQVRRVVRERSVEIVDSYDWSGPLWRHPGVPLVVRLHGAHTAYAAYEHRRVPRFLHFVERRNLGFADSLVAVSRHTGEITLGAFGIMRSYSVIYNGVDTSVFFPRIAVQDDHLVLFAGTICRRKGIYELFRAIPMVLEAVPEARFVFAGRLPAQQESKNRLLTDLLSFIPRAQQGAVRFLGIVPHAEMPNLYCKAGCVVFPSLIEAFALVWAEAMACSSAVVITGRGSAPELVEDGVSGLLVEPTDTNGLARSIIHVLKDGILRRELGQRALSRVREGFSLDVTVPQNIAHFENVIGIRGA